MDQIELAVVSGEVSLLEALDSIRPGTRAVVVVRDRSRPPLLWTAGDLMEACNEAVDCNKDPSVIEVGSVAPTHRPAIAPGLLPASIHPFRADVGKGPFSGPTVNSLAYEQMFDKTDDRYAIHEVKGDTALVVTSSERYTGELRNSVTICKCVGNPVHRFEPWELVVPGRCNKLHHVSVHCSNIDDKP